MNRKFDAIVIGGGVSGLACANVLTEHGIKSALIEAKSHPGGRILAADQKFIDFPVELGAEFVHGVPKPMLQKFDEMGTSVVDVTDDHRYTHANGEQKIDFWKRLQTIEKRMSVRRTTDQSAYDFISAQKSDSLTKSLFLAFVEGFHAADPKKISSKSIAKEAAGEESDLEGVSMFRPVHGYRNFVDYLFRQLHPRFCQVHLGQIVKEIRWKKNSVEIQCINRRDNQETSFVSKCIAITVSVGVLKAKRLSSGYIHWKPRPPEMDRFLQGVDMGHVCRLTFLFKKRFWEKNTDEPLSFLHQPPGSYFPTWWTVSPVRAPILVAWQGGPKALELSFASKDQRIQIAVESLSRALHMTVSSIRKQIVKVFTHNWTRDPFIAGAYSHALVHGLSKVKVLHHPIDHTLYFGGEALASEEARGTVHGAYDVGVRTAKKMISHLT